MKKIILFLLLFFPMFVYASNCDKATIDNLKKQIENVNFNLEYNPSNSTYDATNYFKITAENLPNDFIVRLHYNTELMYILDNTDGVTIRGGVYLVEFGNKNCGVDTIKSYSLMVPYYEEGLENVWFDGTYSSDTPDEQTIKTTEGSISIFLIFGGLVALILIILISAILIRKRRRIK